MAEAAGTINVMTKILRWGSITVATCAIGWFVWATDKLNKLDHTQAIQGEAIDDIKSHENSNRIIALERSISEFVGDRLRLVASYDEFRKATQDALLSAAEERKALMRQATITETKVQTVIEQIGRLDAKIEQLRK